MKKSILALSILVILGACYISDNISPETSKDNPSSETPKPKENLLKVQIDINSDIAKSFISNFNAKEFYDMNTPAERLSIDSTGEFLANMHKNMLMLFSVVENKFVQKNSLIIDDKLYTVYTGVILEDRRLIRVGSKNDISNTVAPTEKDIEEFFSVDNINWDSQIGTDTLLDAKIIATNS